jgi:hypothetical protein
LKFREATKEFKLRMKLNEKAIKLAQLPRDKYGWIAAQRRDPEVGRRMNSDVRVPDPFNHLFHILFPYGGVRRLTKKIQNPRLNFHGLKFRSDTTPGWGYSPTHPADLNLKSRFEDFKHDELNGVLLMLGYKRFKSKKKPEKIKMIMNHR